MNLLQSQLIAGLAVGCRKEKWVTVTKLAPAAAHGWFSGRRDPRGQKGRAGEAVMGGVGGVRGSARVVFRGEPEWS